MSELVTVGDIVEVTFKDLQQLQGTVRFVGEIEKQQGIYYGIELSTSKGKNNGTIGGIRYFKCKLNRGIFVRRSAIVRISATNRDNAVPRIGVHELVGVKFEEEEEYKATVRYIGAPTGLKTNCVYYGIEFEEAIGETSGTHQGIRYFTTKNNKKTACFIKAHSNRIIYPYSYSYSAHTESTIDSDYDDETDSDEDRILRTNQYIDYFTTRYQQNVHKDEEKHSKITCKYYHPLNDWIVNAQNADTFKKRYQCTRSLMEKIKVSTGDTAQALQILNVFAEWLDIENHVVLKKHVLQLLIPFANTLYPNPAMVWIESSIGSNIAKSLITKQWTTAAALSPNKKKKKKQAFASLVTSALIAIYVETELIQIEQWIQWIIETIAANNKQSQIECWHFLSLILEISMRRKSSVWICKDVESLITNTNISTQIISVAKNTLLLNKAAPDVMLPCCLFIYGMHSLFGSTNSKLSQFYQLLLTDEDISIYFESVQHSPYCKIFELCKNCEKYKVKIHELESKKQNKCEECYNLKDAGEGYTDKTDGTWYCIDCWYAFNENKNEQKYETLLSEKNALQKQVEEYELNKIKLNRAHNLMESQYNNKCRQYDELYHKYNEMKTEYDETKDKLDQVELANEQQKTKRIQRMTGDNDCGSRQFRDEIKVLKRKNKRRMSQMQDIYEGEYEKLLKEYQEYKERYPPDENDSIYGQTRNPSATLIIE